MYIVQLEEGVWLAPWDGDPGRTLVKTSAATYGSQKLAKQELERARQWHNRIFADAKITTVKDKLW